MASPSNIRNKLETLAAAKPKVSTRWARNNEQILIQSDDWIQYLKYMDEVINHELRNKKMSQRAYDISQGIINTIDRALPFEDEITLFRGVKTLPNMKVGDNYVDLGFSSKSDGLSVALNFSGPSCCVMIIKYPPGVKQLYFGIDKNVYTKPESEYLTYPGEILKLTETLSYWDELKIPVYSIFSDVIYPDIIHVNATFYFFDYVGNQYSSFDQIAKLVNVDFDQDYSYYLSQLLALLNSTDQLVVQPVFDYNKLAQSYVNRKIADPKETALLYIATLASDLKKDDKKLYRDYSINPIHGIYLISDPVKVLNQFTQYINILMDKQQDLDIITHIVVENSMTGKLKVDFDFLIDGDENYNPPDEPTRYPETKQLINDTYLLPTMSDGVLLIDKILVYMWRPGTTKVTIYFSDKPQFDFGIPGGEEFDIPGQEFEIELITPDREFLPYEDFIKTNPSKTIIPRDASPWEKLYSTFKPIAYHEDKSVGIVTKDGKEYILKIAPMGKLDREYRVGLLLNKLNSPHFVQTLDYASGHHHWLGSDKDLLLLSKAEGKTMDEEFADVLTGVPPPARLKEFLLFIRHLVLILGEAMEKAKFNHNDIHNGNIIVKIADYKDWTYSTILDRSDKETATIEKIHSPYYITIIDYGYSYIQNEYSKIADISPEVVVHGVVPSVQSNFNDLMVIAIRYLVMGKSKRINDTNIKYLNDFAKSMGYYPYYRPDMDSPSSTGTGYSYGRENNPSWTIIFGKDALFSKQQSKFDLSRFSRGIKLKEFINDFYLNLAKLLGIPGASINEVNQTYQLNKSSTVEDWVNIQQRNFGSIIYKLKVQNVYNRGANDVAFFKAINIILLNSITASLF